MKKSGVVVAVVGTVLSLWFGFYVMFIGGIAATVDAVVAEPVVGRDVAFGVARIVFAGLATYVSLAASWFAGGFVYESGFRSRRRRLGR